jgi:hypothetical protein
LESAGLGESKIGELGSSDGDATPPPFAAAGGRDVVVAVSFLPLPLPLMPVPNGVVPVVD